MKRRDSKAECLLVAVVVGAGAAAAGEQGEVPVDEAAIDTAFLEYLGSWDDTDEDWMLFADDDDSTVADRDEGAPDDDGSAEKGDET